MALVSVAGMRLGEEFGLEDRQRHESGKVSHRRRLYIFSYRGIRLMVADGHMEIHVHCRLLTEILLSLAPVERCEVDMFFSSFFGARSR
ncbi:hypothetical protein M404DRAFT_1003195 [Pisolithus tinctorius Marx 270]|uniref:Uncharacterized protein n=1 Tax=Pisolithus tinctorius Marx 270 TaxID=870435 RepID=A0A0C3IWP4_PISTI|nr:hypothetical protein M404DRAFT_1003195 [Pisolithus tinctorius Marx 270]